MSRDPYQLSPTELEELHAVRDKNDFNGNNTLTQMNIYCNSDVTGFCEYIKWSKWYYYRSNVFGYQENLINIEAYVKQKQVIFKEGPHEGDMGWYDDNNKKYDCDEIYLKTGTEWWVKYHILSLNEECVRSNIDKFDKNKMFTYAVTFVKLPKDTEQAEKLPKDTEQAEKLPEDTEQAEKLPNEDILSILPLLKPDRLDDKDNDNILLIACKRLNLTLVKFLVGSCNIKFSAVIRSKGLFSSNKYLLDELIELWNNTDIGLVYFINVLIQYALAQKPPVYLVNQIVLDNVLAYKYKDAPWGPDLVLHTDIKKKYISLLKTELDKLPPQQSLAKTVCNAFTRGCLKTQRVAAEAGGSKKRERKTRKQRKKRNSKRNNKKLHYTFSH